MFASTIRPLCGLNEAYRQNKAWQDAGMAHVTMSVNVSARQFAERNLANRVASALEHSGLEARYLELELTESLVIQNVTTAVATMRELQVLGVPLAIDDFGTVYSSLAALNNFPVGRLKIDKSFIADLADNKSDRDLTSAIISLGQKLNMRVIAEGMETEWQLTFLRDNNCDDVQGFLFSAPVLPKEIERFIGAGTATLARRVPLADYSAKHKSQA
jgi:EAL domain-containing protein (putative c-di-GMP-specific phosphodiesterase class I)